MRRSGEKEQKVRRRSIEKKDRNIRINKKADNQAEGHSCLFHR